MKPDRRLERRQMSEAWQALNRADPKYYGQLTGDVPRESVRWWEVLLGFSLEASVAAYATYFFFF